MCAYHWVIDNHFKHESRAIQYQVRQVVASARSDFQDIFIVDLVDFGRALLLDGDPQSSELDEGVYHEALVQPAMLACPKPRNVFIAGGGEGATLRETLRYATVERVMMVDIDPVMVSLARQHLFAWHRGAFEDPRAQVLHEDARAYLAHTSEKFDCILVDVADPLEGSPAALLYTQEFYAICRDHLTPGGTLALQAEPADSCDFGAHISVVKTVRQCFGSVLPYSASVPFFGSNWGFVLASDQDLNSRLTPEAIEQALRERKVQGLRYYDTETHRHMFALPRFVRQALEDPAQGMIIRDDHLLVVG
jgi:spermidine synthase